MGRRGLHVTALCPPPPRLGSSCPGSFRTDLRPSSAHTHTRARTRTRAPASFLVLVTTSLQGGGASRTPTQLSPPLTSSQITNIQTPSLRPGAVWVQFSPVSASAHQVLGRGRVGGRQVVCPGFRKMADDARVQRRERVFLSGPGLETTAETQAPGRAALRERREPPGSRWWELRSGNVHGSPSVCGK